MKRERFQLTDAQRDAIAAALEHGRLVRYRGGFWSEPATRLDPNGRPPWYFPDSCINQLVHRRHLVVTTRNSWGGPAVVAPFSSTMEAS